MADLRNINKLIRRASFLKRSWKWIAGGIFFLVVVLYVVANSIFGTVINFADSIANFFDIDQLSQEEQDEILYDAGLMAQYLKRHKDEFWSDDDVQYLDYKTTIRVLEAVDAYNQKAAASQTLTYGVKTAIGYRVPSVDPITGEIEVITVEEPTEFASDIIRTNLSNIEHRIEETENMSCVTREDIMRREAMLNSFRRILQQVQRCLEETLANEEAEALERARSRVEYNSETREVTLVHSQMDNGQAIVGEDIFYVRWQPVLALCSMYIDENYENWDSYHMDEDMDEELGQSYYLSDSQIEDVVNLFAYRYTYYDDYIEDNVTSCLWEDFMNTPSGYRIVVETVPMDDGRTKLIVHRQPANAPRCIQNSYVSYTYGYDILENGFLRLKERTYAYSPSKFVTACSGLIEDFEMDRYIDLLSFLPGSEDLLGHYEQMALYAADGVIESKTATTIEECPSIGVLYSMQDRNEYVGGGYYEGENGAISITGEGTIIPLYPINGWNGIYVRPGSWIVEEGNEYGNYLVQDEANLSLTVSDNLTYDEVMYLIEHYFSSDVLSRCPLFETQQAREDTAQCLIDFQNTYGGSICGMLAISQQEGALVRSYAISGWNFFNTVASSGQAVIKDGFRDYKTEYSSKKGTYKTAAVNAYAWQLKDIYDRYLARGQNTYYLMCWNGYNASDGATAYSSISHSYCPPWQDRSMPYDSEGYYTRADGTKSYLWRGSGEGYRGWINNCAGYRLAMYQTAKGM